MERFFYKIPTISKTDDKYAYDENNTKISKSSLGILNGSGILNGYDAPAILYIDNVNSSNAQTWHEIGSSEHLYYLLTNNKIYSFADDAAMSYSNGTATPKIMMSDYRSIRAD